jgi:hypothetical protein
MMCVKLIVPPRERRRWLLITTRLSTISFAGTARTLVAVGTASEACIFDTTRAAAPRSTTVSGSSASSSSRSAASARPRAGSCDLAVRVGAAARFSADGASAG